MGSRDEYVASMKAAYVTISVRLTSAWVASLFPLLGTGVFASIVSKVAEKLFSYLADQTELAAFFYYTDMRVGKQGKEFSDAAFEYRKTISSGTEEQKRLAEEKLWQKFKAFAVLTS